MGADRLGERLVVASPGDELGQLATTFNDLLDRIESAFNRMRQFVADASHELRTPVGVIRSGAAVALTPPVTLDECVETLRVIEDQTARLSRIVDDMFTLARADAGDPGMLAIEDVAVGDLVATCVAAAEPLAAEAGVALEADAAPAAEAYCRGDEGRLEQMLMNVLSNAIRYSGPGGRVRVGLRFGEGGPGRVASISVADTGPGIPAESREAIFERFVRLDAARSRETGGGGLGLPIARWAAETHGGAIAAGEAPGGGALFTITLPVHGVGAGDGRPGAPAAPNAPRVHPRVR
jgi:signal transduction histidine kinase